MAQGDLDNDGEGAVQACFQLWLTSLYDLDPATEQLVRRGGGKQGGGGGGAKKRRSVDL